MEYMCGEWDQEKQYSHDLQVVMSYTTDLVTNFRCLPKLLDKTYLNKHIFLGKDHPYTVTDTGEVIVENEVYITKVDIPVDDFYHLSHGLAYAYKTLWVYETLDHLSTIARITGKQCSITRTRSEMIRFMRQHLFANLSDDMQTIVHKCRANDLGDLMLEQVIGWKTLMMLLWKSSGNIYN